MTVGDIAFPSRKGGVDWRNLVIRRWLSKEAADEDREALNTDKQKEEANEG